MICQSRKKDEEKKKQDDEQTKRREEEYRQYLEYTRTVEADEKRAQNYAEEEAEASDAENTRSEEYER